MTGRIHSFESFGTVDGPGIRFIVFLQGCPLRCQYCHNPDTWGAGGTEYTVEQVVERALRYRNYFGDKGGVTVTGGEPLLQLDFVIELFKILKSKGMNTGVDTSGITFDSQNEKTLENPFMRVDEKATVKNLVLNNVTQRNYTDKEVPFLVLDGEIENLVKNNVFEF